MTDTMLYDKAQRKIAELRSDLAQANAHYEQLKHETHVYLDDLTRQRDQANARAEAAEAEVKRLDDLTPFVSGREMNNVSRDLGQIYRVRIGPNGDYPEIGAVEVQNAKSKLEYAYGQIRSLNTNNASLLSERDAARAERDKAQREAFVSGADWGASNIHLEQLMGGYDDPFREAREAAERLYPSGVGSSTPTAAPPALLPAETIAKLEAFRDEWWKFMDEDTAYSDAEAGEELTTDILPRLSDFINTLTPSLAEPAPEGWRQQDELLKECAEVLDYCKPYQPFVMGTGEWADHQRQQQNEKQKRYDALVRRLTAADEK